MALRALVFAVATACLLLSAQGAVEVVGDLPYGHDFCANVDPLTQSPINLALEYTTVVPNAQPLQHTWTTNPLELDPVTGKLSFPGPATVRLTTSSIYVIFESGRYSLTLNNKTFNAVQMHMHMPSEHAINGMLAMMELHVVHICNATGEIAVVGFVFTLGAPSEFMSSLMNLIPHQAGPDGNMTYTPGQREYPQGFKLGVNEWTQMETALASSYFSYTGSLTTPPCTGNVNWIVLDSEDWALTVSREQVLQFQQILFEASSFVFSSNNRLPFEMMGRQVHYNRVSKATTIMEMKRMLDASHSNTLNHDPAAAAQHARRMLME